MVAWGRRPTLHLFPKSEHIEAVDNRDLAGVGDADSMAQAYAESNSVSLDIAQRNLAVEEEIGKWAPEIEAAIPRTRLAGMSVEVSGDDAPSLRIRITPGEEVPSLEELVRNVDSFKIIVDSGQSSTENRESAIDNSLKAWAAGIPSLQGAYVDEAQDAIVLMVNDSSLPIKEGERLGGEAATNFAASRFAYSPSLPRNSDLVIERTSAASDANRGGRNLRSCTSGFVVRSAGGHKRFLTAGHCGVSQPWYHFGSSAPKATTRKGVQHNTFSDLAWFKLNTNHVLRGKAFYNSTTSQVNNKRNGTNV